MENLPLLHAAVACAAAFGFLRQPSRRITPRPLTNIRPGNPAPAIGPGTPLDAEGTVKLSICEIPPSASAENPAYATWPEHPFRMSSRTVFRMKMKRTKAVLLSN
jgi:hypothetical protein